MGEVATDPSLWAWIRSLVEANMLFRIAFSVIGVIFFVAVLAIGINLIGKNVLGRDDRLFPILLKWFGRQLVRLIPIFRRLKVYLVQTERPKRPLTMKRRIIFGIIMGIYFAVFLGLFFFVYTHNANLVSYTTSSGGILVEVRALRQPTDGFQFDIQFDRPAQIIGVWSDIPQPKPKFEFTIRLEETVGFNDQRDGTRNTVTANYPIATPKRSVFLYFQPNDYDSNSEQLEVEKIRWLSKEELQ